MPFRAINIATALLFLSSIASAQNQSGLVQRSTATYAVVFTSTWSADNHPDDFPAGAHYSPLKGATHNNTSELWSVGNLASPGIESMAETGSNTILDAEINAAIDNGGAEFVVNGPGLNTSPGSADMTFDISSTHSYFSLVSMIAPSPDWFVGINALDLYSGGAWVDTISVVAYVYDAGTDDGTTYTAANAESNPHVDIERIQQSPFAYSGTVVPAGRFSLSLVSVTNTEEQPAPTTRLSGLYPNPVTTEAFLTLTNGTPGPASIQVFDVLGRRVAERKISVTSEITTIKLPTDNLPSGLYVYRVVSGLFALSGTAVIAR